MQKVYIIIPVYNGSLYIERCLKSIFSQTYSNICVILVNDGSTDNTLDIIKTIKDERIVILNQENQGVSVARNNGLNYIQNLNNDSLITFIDADDYVDNDYIEYLVNKIQENKTDIVCCSFCYQTSKTQKKFKQIDNEGVLSCFDVTNLLVKDRTIQSHSHCKLYKSLVWSNIRFPVGVGWMEDQATIFKAFYNADSGVFISNYTGYHYWQEGESACRSKMTNKRVIDSILGYKEVLDYDYSKFNQDQIDIIKQSALDAFANVYLMMIARVTRKNLLNEQKKQLQILKKYIKQNKVIKNYKPFNKKEKIKKICFLFLRPFYKLLYSLFS